MRHSTVELGIVYLHIFIALFYLPLRLIFDSFLWLLLPAFIFTFYFLFFPFRLRRFKLVPIDYWFILMFLYGVVSSVIGIFARSTTPMVQYFIHNFLPLSTYFAARFYTRDSIEKNYRLLQCFYITAWFFVAYIIAEYVWIFVLDIPHTSIPWMKPHLVLNYDVKLVRSILLYRHPAGLTLNLIFAVLFPLLLFRYKFKSDAIKIRPVKGYLLLVLTFISLIFLFIKTSLISILLLIVLTSGLSKSYIHRFITSAIIGIIFILATTIFWDLIRLVYEDYVIRVNNNTGRSDLAEMAHSFLRVAEYYQFDDPSIILGSQVIPFDDTTLFRSTSYTEARILGYPIAFGMGWFLMIIFIGIHFIKYISFFLKFEYFRPIGICLALTLASVLIDFHYGTFIYRGPQELLLLSLAFFIGYYDSCKSTLKRSLGEHTLIRN
ncbi:MAG: hypothetical protein COB67_04255 [SAR324 cluster bacterium]|uniref:Uncharacterized protein n=1 Tax=SAR324 cluster bacterium TaxID=2024889 RepID=A0A2A4T772_9DELT|nr:MAG: hypothetical protein COB67_04255 [SAR324 cluster bacterium]